MNHKILSVLLLALGVGGVSAGTVYYVNTTAPNFCAGLSYYMTPEPAFMVRNGNDRAITVKGEPGLVPDANLQPGESSRVPPPFYRTEYTYTWNGTVTREIVVESTVFKCETKVSGIVVPGSPQQNDCVSLDTAVRVNSTTFALNIRNCGNRDTVLTGYYVRNAAVTGTYQRLSTWNDPTAGINGVKTHYVTLTGGSWTGTQFDFQEGFTYRIQVVTDLGNIVPEWQVPK